ncbi:alpha/beta fold hydrolase [Cellulomonas bogoriensis]|uniref:Alpha/beta hydrolase n=1 Tax=Cellulomonas bogoriensis 69B4 = DSM 16987 TaxID=1386082 RepID=A0A0A0BZQ5_9CELL|nr:alpha/beta hydrolase [Cellulomonas bogoriensis]KGM13873.1 alpha/beta hydrolase [Cellulomonas bogoriensis 69B4 = DSM 16987]
MTDASTVLVDGPWEHRFVAANGARFHVAVAEPADGNESRAPLVLLLHGFPQHWWAWRHQLPALAAEGYRVAAMDLRGAGASDKPPHGYDAPTLCRDVAGVVRSLGSQDAVVVGHGLGGAVAWSMPALEPGAVRAVAALSAPYPVRMRSPRMVRHLLGTSAGRRLAMFQVPWFPERALTRGGLTAQVMQEWSGPRGLDRATVEACTRAMGIPFAAHASMEAVRWAVRSTPRPDGRRYLQALRSARPVPTLQLHGTDDGGIPAAVARGGPGDPYTYHLVPGAGHYLPEEAPEQVTALLAGWLSELPARV